MNINRQHKYEIGFCQLKRLLILEEIDSAHLHYKRSTFGVIRAFSITSVRVSKPDKFVNLEKLGGIVLDQIPFDSPAPVELC